LFYRRQSANAVGASVALRIAFSVESGSTFSTPPSRTKREKPPRSDPVAIRVFVARLSRVHSKTAAGALAKPTGEIVMFKAIRGAIAAGIVGGLFLIPTFTPVSAASNADALKQATATCKADVKERARYHEMSWWAQHKAVKTCVKEASAKH
jgi:hypothetical protein